jgi:phage FluMu protein Com
MWIKDEQVEYVDENSIRVKCPHCQHVSTFKLITQGSNAAGPKMGH